MNLLAAVVRDFERLNELEGKRGLRRERDVAVASQSCSGSARASAGRCADSRAFSAASKSTDKRADTRAAADHGSSPLTLALADLCGRRSVNAMGPALDFHGG
jgi:hypothetical protein